MYDINEEILKREQAKNCWDHYRSPFGYESEEGRKRIENATERVDEIHRLLGVANEAKRKRDEMWRKAKWQMKEVRKRWELMGKAMEEIEQLWAEMDSI